MAQELEQLRQQYNSLKEEINKQNNVNERLIRESIKKDMSLINMKKWVSIVAGAIAIPLIYVVSMELDLGLVFTVISVVWLLSMVIGNILRNRELNISMLSSGSMQSFADEMHRRKTNQFKWVRINFSLFVIWVGCFIGECFRVGLDRDILIPVIVGVLTGTVIGLAAGFRMHNRLIGAYENIIAEIEEN